MDYADMCVYLHTYYFNETLLTPLQDDPLIIWTHINYLHTSYRRCSIIKTVRKECPENDCNQFHRYKSVTHKFDVLVL